VGGGAILYAMGARSTRRAAVEAALQATLQGAQHFATHTPLEHDMQKYQDRQIVCRVTSECRPQTTQKMPEGKGKFRIAICKSVKQSLP
jgi:hypothetical protein